MSPVTVVSSEDRERVDYPTLHITGEEKIDFPAEGVITLRYRKVASSEDERHGEMHYSCTLEAHQILDLYAEDMETHHDMPESESKKTEKILDDHMAEMEKKNRKSKGY
jgi:hypothetical protein